jgi:endoglucanase
MKRYTKMWSQITAYFKDEPGTLIFESLNEEGCFNDVWNRYGGGTAEQKAKAYGILNAINQAFVDLVRKSGGLNGKRHLLIAGYATDIDLTVDPAFVMPKDPAGHCIVSVHYYTPYTFAGLEHDETWGKARSTWGDAKDLEELNAKFDMLKPRFLDKGIPVIVGEYGATWKTKEPESVRRYLRAVAAKAFGMGMCPMLWDPGTHFDRHNLEFKDPESLKGFQSLLGTKRE